MKRLLTILILLVAAPVFAADGTTTASINLKCGINIISVRAPYTGDDDDSNSALVEYKTTAGSTWFEAYTPYIDRRENYEGKSCADQSNSTYQYEARVVIVGLTAGTAYDVRVTWTDEDGVSGTNPQSDSITTHPNDPTAYMTGSTYYAVAGGGDTDCSVGTPCSISDAMSTVSAGDTITMTSGGGDYDDFDITISGDASNYIKFVGDGSTVVDGGSDVDQINISGDYIWVSNLQVEAVGNTASYALIQIENSASNVWITEVTFPDNECSGSYCEDGDGSLTMGSGANIFILNNSFNRTTAYNATNTSNPYTIKGTSTNNFVLKGNTIDGNWLGGFDTKSDSLGENIQISGNTWDRTPSSGSGGQAMELDGSAVNVAAYENVCGSDADTEWNQCFSFAPIMIGPTYIARNRAYGSFSYWGKVGNGGDGGVYIFHNTFVGPSEGINEGGSSSTCPTIHAWTIYNNIFDITVSAVSKIRVASTTQDYNMINTTNTPITWYYNGSGVRENNNTWVAHQADGFDANGLNATATFVDETNGDLDLAEGSAGIDVGVELKNWNDSNSAWPYSGSAPDIGADEFEQQTGTITGVTISYIHEDRRLEMLESKRA